MKIIVLGSYYSDNLGDGVICECVARQLQNRYPQAEVTICDLLDRNSFQKEKGISMRLLSERRLHLVLRRLVTKWGFIDKQHLSSASRLHDHMGQVQRVCSRKCDLAVFAGGQMFMDSYALIVKAYVEGFAVQGVPVLMNACGTGPTYSPRVRAELSQALMNPQVKWISTRDDGDAIERYYLQGEKRVDITYDPALWSSELYQVSKDRNAVEIGLGILYPDTEQISPRRAARFWWRLICQLEREGVVWRMFVNGGVGDLTFAHWVYHHLPASCRRRPFEDCMAAVPVQPEELLSTIAQFAGIISFRLHSHIIASSLDVPSVAVVWDDKLNFFFEKIGHPERCVYVTDAPEQVLIRLRQAMREGCPRDLLEKQKQYAGRLLLRAVESELRR